MTSTYRTSPIAPASAATSARTVTIDGWLHNRRSSGKIHFLMVRDGTGFIQAVMAKNDVGEAAFTPADHLSQETSLSITRHRPRRRARQGRLRDRRATARGHRRRRTTSRSRPKEHGVDFLMDRRHLWIRTERQTAILRVRHEVVNAVRDFFNGAASSSATRRSSRRPPARARPRSSRCSTSTTPRPT